MLLRLMPIALGALFVWGCDEDSTRVVKPGFDPGPTVAGSCNLTMGQGTCDEYAAADATPATAQSCMGAGGTWTAGKCPFEGRIGLCTATNPATRTYAYTVAAAGSLQSSCPAMNFVMYELPAGSGGRGGRGGAGSGGAGAGGSAGSAGSDDDAGSM